MGLGENACKIMEIHTWTKKWSNIYIYIHIINKQICKYWYDIWTYTSRFLQAPVKAIRECTSLKDYVTPPLLCDSKYNKSTHKLPHCYDDLGLGLDYLAWCRIKWHTLEGPAVGHPGAKMRDRCQDHTSHSHSEPALHETRNRKQLILLFQSPCKAQLGGLFWRNCPINSTSQSTNSTDPFTAPPPEELTACLTTCTHHCGDWVGPVPALRSSMVLTAL